MVTAEKKLAIQPLSDAVVIGSLKFGTYEGAMGLEFFVRIEERGQGQVALDIREAMALRAFLNKAIA